ncbi:MAG: Response regulator with antiterminator output domain [Ilumatobacteraceae bacterium]|nr:Response regulator with antiterminator output domain [Ilumatobacteraceae bacterium]
MKALGAFLVTEQSLGDTLRSVAELSKQVAPAAAFAGMLLSDERGRPGTWVFTDDEAPEIDEAQYSSDQGPCLDAWRLSQVVSVADMSGDEAQSRYPDFAAACSTHGVRSTLSLPIMSQDSALGALNLYAREPDGFSPDDEQALTTFGVTAGVLVANSKAYWGAYELSQQLDEAMSSRSGIEQAKGILMARSGDLDADGAFEMLRQASRRENVKLRVIAQRIVERRMPPDQPGDDDR